jgi:hypothetical protein
LFDAPARRPKWRVQDRRPMRRVQPLERCRVVVTRESLKDLTQAMPAAKKGDEIRATNELAKLLKDSDMKREDAWEACKHHKIGPRVFRERVWPEARKKAGLPPARVGRRSEQKSAR